MPWNVHFSQLPLDGVYADAARGAAFDVPRTLQPWAEEEEEQDPPASTKGFDQMLQLLPRAQKQRNDYVMLQQQQQQQQRGQWQQPSGHSSPAESRVARGHVLSLSEWQSHQQKERLLAGANQCKPLPPGAAPKAPASVNGGSLEALLQQLSGLCTPLAAAATIGSAAGVDHGAAGRTAIADSQRMPVADLVAHLAWSTRHEPGASRGSAASDQALGPMVSTPNCSLPRSVQHAAAPLKTPLCQPHAEHQGWPKLWQQEEQQRRRQERWGSGPASELSALIAELQAATTQQQQPWTGMEDTEPVTTPGLAAAGMPGRRGAPQGPGIFLPSRARTSGGNGSGSNQASHGCEPAAAHQTDITQLLTALRRATGESRRTSTEVGSGGGTGSGNITSRTGDSGSCSGTARSEDRVCSSSGHNGCTQARAGTAQPEPREDVNELIAALRRATGESRRGSRELGSESSGGENGGGGSACSFRGENECGGSDAASSIGAFSIGRGVGQMHAAGTPLLAPKVDLEDLMAALRRATCESQHASGELVSSACSSSSGHGGSGDNGDICSNGASSEACPAGATAKEPRTDIEELVAALRRATGASRTASEELGYGGQSDAPGLKTMAAASGAGMFLSGQRNEDANVSLQHRSERPELQQAVTHEFQPRGDDTGNLERLLAALRAT
jgi:hypothetical protein